MRIKRFYIYIILQLVFVVGLIQYHLTKGPRRNGCVEITCRRDKNVPRSIQNAVINASTEDEHLDLDLDLEYGDADSLQGLCPSRLQNASTTLPICRPKFRCYNGSDIVPFRLDFHDKSHSELIQENLAELSLDQWFQPCDCHQPRPIAIIIPFRDRDLHLRLFLNNILPFLRFQLQRFKIFIIEQEYPQLFNRAALMNIGYLEVLKLYPDIDCFIFHDIDLVPENLCNIYQCLRQPLHLAAAMNKFDYQLPYLTYCGGVLAMDQTTIQKINGFANVMFGWGGEDDDIYARLRMANITIVRYATRLAHYTMLNHTRDTGNPESARSMRTAFNHWKYSKYDGLSTAIYNVSSLSTHPLYTKVRVAIPGPTTAAQNTPYYRSKVLEFHRRLTTDPTEKARVLQVIRAKRKEDHLAKMRDLRRTQQNNHSSAIIAWAKKNVNTKTTQ